MGSITPICKLNCLNKKDVRNMEIYPRIEANPEVQGGIPVIKGTRVPVVTVLRWLAKGLSFSEVACEFGISEKDVQAVVAFAAERIAEERYLIAA